MSTPNFENVPIVQGSDWYLTVNWYGGGTFRAPIEEITAGYPTLIRVTAHSLPSSSDTPVIISGVEGMEILNSKDTGIELVKRIDADTFEVPVSTRGKDWTMDTGEITWYKPTDITDYTARCQMRKRWHSANYVFELTTENNGIVLDANDASIQLQLTAAQTATIVDDILVYDVELVSPGGTVTQVFRGSIKVDRENTR